MPRPAGPSRPVEHDEDAHGEDEEARHVVVVLRPRVLFGLARGQGVVDGRGGGEELLHRRRGEARQLGSKRAATSAGLARSATTSTAGGSEVSEAAAKRMVMPIPTSASMKARMRARAEAGAGAPAHGRTSR